MNLLVEWYPGDAAVALGVRVIVAVTLTIGLAGLLSFVALRRRPAARHALWLGVLISVAAAPFVLAGIERAGWKWSVRRPASLAEVPTLPVPRETRILTDATLDSALPLNGPGPAGVTVPEVADGAHAPAIPDRQAPIAAATPQVPVDVWRSLASLATVLWLAGACFLLARLLRGDRQVRRLLADTQLVDPRQIDGALAIMAERLGVDRLPPIVTSPAVTGPVVAGLLKPTVVVPAEFVRHARAMQLADVLIHECAHALRRDPWVGLAQRLVQLVFWPHPLVYVMNRSLSRAREEVCDNYVLRGGDAAGYAQTLLELAGSYGEQPMPAATLAMFGSRWKLEERVAGLLDPHRHRDTRFGRAKFLALVALLVAGGSALAAGGFDEPRKPEGTAIQDQKVAAPAVTKSSPASERILRALDKPTTVDFIDLPLNDALTFLHDYHGIALRIDKEALDRAKVSLDTPISLKLQGVSLRSVLKLILEPVGLEAIVGEGELVVTTREQAAATLRDHSYSVRHQLGPIVSAGIPAADLAEAIKQTIGPGTWQNQGGRGTVRVEEEWLHLQQVENVLDRIDVLVHELLQAVRDPALVAADDRLETREHSVAELHGLKVPDAEILEWLHEALLAGEPSVNGHPEGASIKGDRLILRQPAWIQAAANNFLAVLTLHTRSSGRATPGWLTFELAKTLVPMDDRRRVAHRRLARPVSLIVVNLPLEDALLVVRDQSLMKVQISGQLSAKPIFQAPISLKFENESLSSVLDKLLIPQGLDWYLLDPDTIVVTTRAEVVGRLEPRVYRTKELLAAGQTEKGLLARIATIEPDSWGALGGPGQLRFLPGVLIVNHNRHVHEQIERLLATLARGQIQPDK